MANSDLTHISLGKALVDVKVTLTPTQSTAVERHRSDLMNIERAEALLDVLGPDGQHLLSAFEIEVIRSRRGNTSFELDRVGKMQQVLNVVCLFPESGVAFDRLLAGLRHEQIGEQRLAAQIESTEQQERRAAQARVLQDFYHALGGKQWHHDTNWLTDAPLSSWYGLELEDGNVWSIRLDSNNLRGNLPPSIGELKALRELHVGCNELGPLPDAIGGLTSLRVLHAHRSAIPGAIPESLGELRALEELWLQANALEGSIPDSIGGCKSLQRLELWSNMLTGHIPEGIGRLNKLAEFKAWSNKLSGPIPGAIGLLGELVELNLRSNHLSGTIPDALGKCHQLIQCYLQSNHLEGRIPDSITECRFLYKLSVWGNHLEGLEDTRRLMLDVLGRQVHFSF